MKKEIKKFLLQLVIILVLSFVIALAYNQFSRSPLPIFSEYMPEKAKDSDEDLSVYFNEIDVETLRVLMESDMAVLLDARKTGDFNGGHIPKAVSMPIGEFKEKYDKTVDLLAEGKSIVIYCIGVNCIDSSLLAKELHQKGHRDIYVYKGGMEEWQELGYPVETPAGGVN